MSGIGFDMFLIQLPIPNLSIETARIDYDWLGRRLIISFGVLHDIHLLMMTFYLTQQHQMIALYISNLEVYLGH